MEYFWWTVDQVDVGIICRGHLVNGLMAAVKDRESEQKLQAQLKRENRNKGTQKFQDAGP